MAFFYALLTNKIAEQQLKVSKSQKHFFLETPLQKKGTKYLTKCCPSFIGQNFWQWNFKKNVF